MQPDTQTALINGGSNPQTTMVLHDSKFSANRAQPTFFKFKVKHIIGSPHGTSFLGLSFLIWKMSIGLDNPWGHLHQPLLPTSFVSGASQAWKLLPPLSTPSSSILEGCCPGAVPSPSRHAHGNPQLPLWVTCCSCIFSDTAQSCLPSRALRPGPTQAPSGTLFQLLPSPKGE